MAVPCAPSSLALAANTYRCIPWQKSAKTLLLCEWARVAQASSATNTFVAVAQITDANVRQAVYNLVYGLMSTGDPAFWDREVLIYPIAQNAGDAPAQMAASHSINLKTPGENSLVYGGTGSLTHTVLGMFGAGLGVTAYGDTQYVMQSPLTAKLMRFFWYLQQDDPTSARYYWGCSDNPNVDNRCYARSLTGPNSPLSYGLNAAAGASPYTGIPSQLGAWCVQRKDDATVEAAYGATNFVDTALGTSVGLPDFSLTLLTYHNVNPPTAPTAAALSGFSLGLPFISNAEWLQYQAIWQAYETAMGRAH